MTQVVVEQVSDFPEFPDMFGAAAAREGHEPVVGLRKVVEPFAVVFVPQNADAHNRVEFGAAVRCPKQVAEGLFVSLRELVAAPLLFFVPTLPAVSEYRAEQGRAGSQQGPNQADDRREHRAPLCCVDAGSSTCRTQQRLGWIPRQWVTFCDRAGDGS
jgi:hypothetical protein